MGPEDQGELSKPSISCSKSLVDCCSRTLEVALQSRSASPAREQHETAPGASLMALSVSPFIVSPACQREVAGYAIFRPASCAISEARAFMCERPLSGRIGERRDMRPSDVSE